MAAKPSKTLPPERPDGEQRKSLLSASAESAKFLILLQVSSRVLTFIVNQVLLRYLSPELLGVSVQLELFMTTILYFSRDSIRTALQRQTTRTQTQAVINLSLLALPLGVFFAGGLSLFYTRSFASPETAEQPFFLESIGLYALATILELAAEPWFALAQLRLRYKLRAGAESAAATVRCILTCGVTLAAARGWVEIGGGVGPLPFAVGQLGYAVVLFGVYWWGVGGEIGEWKLALRGITPR